MSLNSPCFIPRAPRHSFVDLRANSGENPPPIFTVDVFFNKIYVITSPRIVQCLQRNTQKIGFDLLLDASLAKIAGLEGQGKEYIERTDSHGNRLYRSKDATHKTQSAYLNEGLDQMSQGMIAYLDSRFHELGNSNICSSLDLVSWTAHTATIALTDGIYGPYNPFRAREVEQAFRYEISVLCCLPSHMSRSNGL